MSSSLIFKRTYAVRAIPRPRDPLTTSLRATSYDVAPGVTLVHRPPPTSPSPYSLTTNPASPLLALRTPPPPPAPEISLPPQLRKPRPPPVVLTPEQVEEIKALRVADPVTNTSGEISRRFGCSKEYVRAIAPLPKVEARKAAERKLIDEGRHKWGDRKRLIHELRQRRRDFW